MKIEILIISHRADFQYLELCLRSLKKFVTGFERIVVLIPHEDLELLKYKEEDLCMFGPKISIRTFDQAPPPLGFLHHEIMVCRADEICPNADFIFHFDSDQIFTEPVHLSDFYFHNDKPILVVEPYDNVPEIKKWQAVVEQALGWRPKYETMRRPGWMHHCGIYADVRRRVEQHTNRPFDEYVLSCKPDYPQGFAEQNTIGAVALELPWREKYAFVEIGKQRWPKNVIQQFWSLGNMDLPQDVWVDGHRKTIVPRQFAENILA